MNKNLLHYNDQYDVSGPEREARLKSPNPRTLDIAKRMFYAAMTQVGKVSRSSRKDGQGIIDQVYKWDDLPPESVNYWLTIAEEVVDG
jgi:hypothetical protein